jgi:Uma2 family endonuclease
MTRAAKQATPRELTLDEYMATPETKRRQEVIDGVIVPMPSPSNDHQWVLLNLVLLFSEIVRGSGLGSVLMAPCDLLIRTQPKLRMRQPDLMVFSAARVSPEELRRMRYGEVAPDLAVEIRSASETDAGWAEKLADYASIGVVEVWRVHLEDRSVEVLQLAEGRYERAGLFQEGESAGSVVLAGLIVPVDSIFQ